MSPIILATGDLGTQLPCKSPTTCFPALSSGQLTLLRTARFFVASIFLICAGSETQWFGDINTSPFKLTCDPSWEVEPSQPLDKAERLFVWDQLLAPSGCMAMAGLWMAPVVWTVMQEVCYFAILQEVMHEFVIQSVETDSQMRLLWWPSGDLFRLIMLDLSPLLCFILSCCLQLHYFPW